MDADHEREADPERSDEESPRSAGGGPVEPQGNAEPQATAAVGPTQDERTWALLAHLLSLVGSFIAPLVIWLVKKEEGEFVAEHAKESLNFQITMLIASAVASALICLWVGVLLLPLVFIYDLVMVIIATLKASEGQKYSYPLTLRLIQ